MTRRARTASGCSTLLIAAVTACGEQNTTALPRDIVPASIHVAPNPASVRQNASLTLSVTVLNATGDTIPGAPLNFQSADTSLVHVSSTGVVTPTGRVGYSAILISSDSAGASVPVRVVAIPTSILGLPASLRIGQGGYYPVRGVVLDVFGHPMVGAPVTLTPISSTLLSVVDTTFVHAVGGTGTTGVVATYADTVGSVPPDTIAVTVAQFGSPTGTIVDTFVADPLFGVAVSATRAFLSTWVVGGDLLALDLPARGYRPPITGGSGLGIAMDTSGSTVYVAGLGQDTVKVVDAVADEITAYISDHIVGDPRDVILSPDGQRLYVAVDYTKIYVVSTTSRTVIDSISVPGLPNDLSCHPTAHLLYASLDNSQVAEINLDSDKVVRLFPAGTDVQGIAVAPDGSELYSVTMENVLSVFNLSTGQQVATVPGLGGYRLAVSHDGSRLYVAGNENVKIVDRLARTLIDSIVVGGFAAHIAVSRDDGAVFVANLGSQAPRGGWLNVIY